MVTGRSSGKVSTGCLVGGLVFVVVFGVGGYFLWDYTKKLLAEKVKVQVRDNPVVREHLGELETVEIDLTATSASDDEDELVFQAQGSKGAGELRVEFDNDGERIERGTLRLPSGKSYDLFPDGRD